MKSIFQKLFYLFFPIIIGSIIGFGIKGSIDYDSLIQPPLSPRGIIFTIVWTILYLLIGIAYFFYRKNHNDFKVNVIYYTQLFFNFTWPILFFVFKLRMLSIIWIMILLFMVLFLLFAFYQSEKRSFYLFIPYLLWLLFAFYLNFGVYLLN